MLSHKFVFSSTLVLKRTFANEARRALRQHNKNAKVSAFKKRLEQAKTGSYFVAAGVGATFVVGLGAVLLWEKFNSGSAYAVYDAAVDVVKEDDYVKQHFGSKPRFFGERSAGRGHHSGLRHRSFLNPKTGEQHMQVTFYIEDFEGTQKATIFAEKRQRKGVVFPYWEWVEITLEPERRGFKRRARKHPILMANTEEEKKR